jgi:two-component system sensor histidine kinase BaeS
LACKRVIGVLNVESDLPLGFDNDDLETLKALAGLASIALRNVRIGDIQRAAHDLYNSLALSPEPLTDLKALCAGAGSPTSKRIPTSIDEQLSEVRFQARLADDIRAAARVLNQQPLVLKKQSLAILIKGVIAALQKDADRKGVTLVAVLPIGDDLSLEFDADRMKQVITNLVANAIKYTRARSKVLVRAERRKKDRRIVVDVVDHGPNAPPAALLEKIFEPYVRVADAEKDGQGLGLSIAKTYVELHGGRIHAKRNIRSGLTVSFEL